VSHPTSVPKKWHRNPSNCLNRVYECDRVTTDERHRDHVTEMCVGVGGTACVAIAIPPNNKLRHRAVLSLFVFRIDGYSISFYIANFLHTCEIFKGLNNNNNSKDQSN